MDLIVRPEPADVRTVWPGEARDFTPWLAENPDWLSDVLDLGPLTTVAIEAQVPGVNRYLDILMTTATGVNIAVENQYRRVDHDHLTRGLAYAVALDCRALVVVAEDHASEFVAIADYLNKAFEALGVDEGGIAVYLVSLGINKVGASYVPTFNVISSPNRWLVEVQAAQAPGGRSPGSKDAFVSQCASAFQPSATAILNDWEARDRGFLRFNPGSASVSLDYPYDPSSPTKTSIFVLYKDGQMTVNRGYFLESVIPEDRVDEMDSRIAEAFPGYKRLPFYPVAYSPDPAGVAAFASWLIAEGSNAGQR
ncbi:hypothetical protein [Nocardioides sp.]|uniref:hypothetical protein n=1 Tax=Nocardioides sp. TaxID=35761 RepID=UPI0025EEB520|nr:hypothetical protein [Nocardioides sp.]